MKQSIRVFSPASISNMGSGFDIIGFPLDAVGDEVQVTLNHTGQVTISGITGESEGIPLNADKNVASYAAMHLLKAYDATLGADISIVKHIKAGSGIGSSAASSAGAVVALNELLGKPFGTDDLIRFAMKGEALISGGEHADNVAPVISGGITLIRSYTPLDIIRIKPPKDMWTVVLHPQIAIRTALSRGLLPEKVPLKKAVTQWGNVAGLIAGLYTSDFDLIGRSMQDVIAEPLRAELIPGFQNLRQIARDNGAAGFSISGSGPSMFALCKGQAIAQQVEQAMNRFYQRQGIPYYCHVSQVNTQGVKVLNHATVND